jgi:hypothetical protein
LAAAVGLVVALAGLVADGAVAAAAVAGGKK